jgi:tripartite-type tricarboxylate transporter receptor subunit TctC
MRNSASTAVAELVALLKKNPGKYNFGSIGNGSLSHLAMEASGSTRNVSHRSANTRPRTGPARRARYP